MPGTVSSISVFAFDLDDRGQAVQAWETVVDASDTEGIEEAKQMASSHAGVLVVRRDGNPVVGEEGDPVVVYRSGKTDGFD